VTISAINAATAPGVTLVKRECKEDAPQSNVTDRVRKFFTDNPTEELSVSDASVKLGISPRTAQNILSTLAGRGELERTSIYRLKEGT
jgi:Fic family protein